MMGRIGRFEDGRRSYKCGGVEVWRCGGGRKNVEFSTQAPKAATYFSEGIYPFAPRSPSPKS
jgi:hypothetical protein